MTYRKSRYQQRTAKLPIETTYTSWLSSLHNIFKEPVKLPKCQIWEPNPIIQANELIEMKEKFSARFILFTLQDIRKLGGQLQVCLSDILTSKKSAVLLYSPLLLINLVIEGTRADWVEQLIMEKEHEFSQGLDWVSCEGKPSILNNLKATRGLLLGVFQAIV